MNRTITSIIALILCITVNAQTPDPQCEFVLDLNVALEGEFIGIGTTPVGGRSIIPITGGTFEGPDIKGIVVAGGADYQTHSATTNLTEVNAIYSIRTDDGVNIYVHNQGIISQNGYFFTTPHFQAPVDSKYAWLNEAIYVCKPIGFGQGSITLRVWRVVEGKN